jgi:hypothetical protein
MLRLGIVELFRREQKTAPAHLRIEIAVQTSAVVRFLLPALSESGSAAWVEETV